MSRTLTCRKTHPLSLVHRTTQRATRSALRLELLEDRSVPSTSLGQQWLLQVDGLTGTGTQQLVEIQQRLSSAGVAATAVRHLGLDGLALIQTVSDQSFSALEQALSRMDGYRYVRANRLGEAPLFSIESSAGLSPVPGEWVLHLDGFTGSAAAQEQRAKLFFDGLQAGVEVQRQLGRDGVFAIRTAPDRTFADLDRVLRNVPGYRRLEANTVGWVIRQMPTDPTLISPPVPGEWIVQFEGVTGTRAEQVQLIQQRLDAAGAKATVKKQLGHDGLVTIRTDPGRSFEDLHRALSAVTGYRGQLEPNGTVQLALTPNDPRYQSGELYGLNKINAPAAWDLTTGSSSIVVGVIDSGIDYTHPDLIDNMWRNPGEVPGNLVDDDLNGYADDYYGYDFLNNDSDPFDEFGHGTHVAGTIGAQGNNGIGVVGVNWDVQLMALKFNGAMGGSDADAIEAINYATMMRNRGINVKLTCNSWGAPIFSQPLKDAIQNSGNAGLLFVAAAGNSGSDNDQTQTAFYPASFDLPNIISVAATDSNDNLATFSNFGAISVDLAAPGVGILSTVPLTGVHGDPSRYKVLQGTSMATPHVAGTAVLVWSLYPSAIYQEVRDAVIGGIDPITMPAGKNTRTNGRLNADVALDRNDKDIVVTGADSGGGPHVRVFFARPAVARVEKFGYMAYETSFTGGVRVAAGDVNNDGIADVMTVPGPGGGPLVRIWDGRTGALIREWLAYDSALRTGLFVAAGDTTGDGLADVITAPDAGTGPNVKIFNGTTGAFVREFLAYSADQTLGVRVAVGRFYGDPRADIIVAPGPGGSPLVKVFDALGQFVPISFFAYATSFTGGVYVGAGFVDGDGQADIITGPGSGSGPNVKVFRGGDLALIRNFNAFDASYTGGVRVAGADVNGDGKEDILAAQAQVSLPLERAFDATTLAQLSQITPYSGVGIFVGGKRRRF